MLAEASEARRRGKLVPVTIDDAKPPLVFRQLQTADFTGWSSEDAAAPLQALAHDIASLMATPSTQPGSGSTATKHVHVSSKAGRRSAKRRVLLAVLLLVGGGGGGLAYQQQKEQAEVTLAANLLRGAVDIRQQLLKQHADGRDYWWAFLAKEGGKELLQRSTLLVVEAMRRRPSADAEKVLRDNLVLLTRPIAELDYEGFHSSTLAISPDGKYLATASGSYRDNSVRLWDAATLKMLARLEHDSSLESVTFSPDGKYLASTGSDNTARLWALPDGDEVFRVRHENRVITAAFSADSAYLVWCNV